MSRINKFIIIANQLDLLGLLSTADIVDKFIKKSTQDDEIIDELAARREQNAHKNDEKPDPELEEKKKSFIEKILNPPTPTERRNETFQRVVEDPNSLARTRQADGENIYYNAYSCGYIASDHELTGQELEDKRKLLFPESFQNKRGNFWVFLPARGGIKFVASTPQGIIYHMPYWKNSK